MMDCTSTSLKYEDTEYFTKIVLAYINKSPELLPFYRHPVNIEGIKAAIHQRKQYPVDRNLLVEELNQQYQQAKGSEAVSKNIELLLQPETFTIVTAHQPNIFTGYLYFIYKILHIIKLAETLKKEIPAYHFVPVFYIGSEDADLDELGKINLNGDKLVWDTQQKGAVGRMSTKGLEKMITRIEGELSVHPYGNELVDLLKKSYLDSPDIQIASFRLIDHLFSSYGLVILLPDNARLKRQMASVFKEELWQQKASTIVEKTNAGLSAHFKVQANPREINLFYLREGIRARIIRVNDEWRVAGHDIRFNEKELELELEEHPERFSPNVILRGLYQEMILPNIAFAGGGGELAYWLELKDLFEYYQVPYPVLLLRNSFLLVEEKWKDKIDRLGFKAVDFFRTAHALTNEYVTRSSGRQLDLQQEISEASLFYQRLGKISSEIDRSLQQHVAGLEARAIKKLQQLEKKLLKAERKKHADAEHQIHVIKDALFPKGNLQERTDNFMPYYAKWGPAFIEMLYQHSPAFNEGFVIIHQNHSSSH